ncbi:MAG TPA: hypothetical protein VFU47_01390 [Armatimonadota bacterium]|nr:hypothetical protein [Armatimonadota bacterium]
MTKWHAVSGGTSPGPTLAVAPVTAWTDPAAGNLVTWDTGGNQYVDECAADENPIGQVIAVNPAATVLTVELFTGGMVAVLPYSGAPALGNKVEADGTTDSDGNGKVRPDNVNGVGRVIARDRVSGYVDVYFG